MAKAQDGYSDSPAETPGGYTSVYREMQPGYADAARDLALRKVAKERGLSLDELKQMLDAKPQGYADGGHVRDPYDEVVKRRNRVGLPIPGEMMMEASRSPAAHRREAAADGYQSAMPLTADRVDPRIAVKRLPGASIGPGEPDSPRRKVLQALSGGDPYTARGRFVRGVMGDDGYTEPGIGLYDVGKMALYATPAAPVAMGLDALDFASDPQTLGPLDVGMAAMGLRNPGLRRALMGGAAAMGGYNASQAYAEGGAVSKAAKAASKLILPGDDLAAPTILRPDRPLFDYSRLAEVPDVPQFDLPRNNPPRGPSERIGDLVNNPAVRDKLGAIIDRGIGMGGREWYNNEPLRQRFVEQLGDDEGNSAFRRYMDYVAASSPRSKVDANARNATFYYALDRQGLPLPDKNPQPYGHMAQKLHRGNAEDIQANGGWDVFKNPKPASFVENLTGNQMPGTMDAHAIKLPAMLAEDPRFLATSYQWVDKNKVRHTFKPRQMYANGEISMQDALARPAFFDAQPNENEYGALEQMYKDIAAQKGLSPAQAQASAWVGGGHITDLGSSSDPFLKVFEDRVRLTADKTGQSPESVLRRFIAGDMPLLSHGGRVHVPC